MDSSTRASLDRMERAGYLPALRSIAKSACVPFWWHGQDEDGTYRVYHNGTVCFVHTGKRLIAVTAQHVFDRYRTNRRTRSETRCQFGSTTIEPEARLIADSEYLDLVTFDVRLSWWQRQGPRPIRHWYGQRGRFHGTKSFSMGATLSRSESNMR
jgi:hypothetical protein